MNETDARGNRHRRGAIGVAMPIAVTALFATGCSSGGDDVVAAPSPTAVATTTAPASPVTTVTEPAPESSTATTGAPPSTAPPTTESCGAFCPLTDEQQTATDAFFAAYNGDDWDAFLDVLATDEPSWAMTPSQTQNTELMRYDFIWSAAMNETWTPERCIDQYGVVSCSVSMEDDLHRLLAPYEMEPSVCQISFEVVDGKVLPKRYDALYGCHGMYDGAMHFFGSWLEATYPGIAPIQGAHYRGWNQTDETAGERAASYLDEWAVVVEAAFAGGGSVHDVTGHP